MSSETHANTTDAAPDTTSSFRVEGISKSFGHVQALDEVSLEVNRGEVIGLVGENGAGKSTLLNILTGVLEADDGQLYVDGDPVRTWDDETMLASMARGAPFYMMVSLNINNVGTAVRTEPWTETLDVDWIRLWNRSGADG